jgi:hypothetical protein
MILRGYLRAHEKHYNPNVHRVKTWTYTLEGHVDTNSMGINQESGYIQGRICSYPVPWKPIAGE